MAFDKRTVRDIDVDGKTVLLRTDHNVPIKDGKITDDLRIKAGLPTISYLLDHGAGVVVCSHLGRPGGKTDPNLSLRPVALRLSELLGRNVGFVEDCASEEAQSSVEPGQVVMLENLRFHPGEEASDEQFAQRLATGKDIYVNDAFGVDHHPAASLVTIASILPNAAGLLLEREIHIITDTLDNPEQPFVAILGGAKVSGKIDLIDNLMKKGIKKFMIGGAMANTFLVSMGQSVGSSLYEPANIDDARRILKDAADKGIELVLPGPDVAIGEKLDPGEKRREVPLSEIEDRDIILDLGERSLAAFLSLVEGAKTVIWNGTLGMTEYPEFVYASKRLADVLAAGDAKVIIGGGDTAGFIGNIGMGQKFTHVSTGGGAALEVMAGKELPGVAVLQDKA